MPPDVLILVAMHPEATIVRRALGRKVAVRVIGIGAKFLPTVDEVRATGGIILAGFAGALDPTLKVGDVILDAPDGDFPPGTGVRGTICSSVSLVTTPSKKAALFAATGAVAVDMESDAVRALAKAAGVPFIGLRAISDTAQEAIDPAILRIVDSTGRVRPLRLTTTLLRRPSLLPQLLRLGRAAKFAGEGLSAALRQLVTVDDVGRAELTKI